MINKLTKETLRDHKGYSFVGITTCFIMYTKDGEFFMAKRSNKTRDEHGRWEIQGGGLDFGQTAEENVIREMKEESNATPLKSEFLGYTDVFRVNENGDKTHWLALDFAFLVNKSDVKINEPDMFDDSGWFTLSNIPSPVHSQLQNLLNKHADRLQKIIK